ncbi:MAG: aminotransferase class IV [Myxococcota bacterium]
MSAVVYLNGSFVPVGEARIGVRNGGWLHGAGLFETMRAEHGRVFRVEKHLDRLIASAEKLLVPVDRGRLPGAQAFGELLERNGLARARVRLTVSAGDVLEAVEGEARALTVCATSSALEGYPESRYAAGVTAMLSRHRQSAYDPLAGHKTTSYLPRLVALKEAHEAGCAEALWFTPENLLAEGSISNVFVVSGGEVVTPPTGTPVLPGIARQVVLELCGGAGRPVREGKIDINGLLDADEVFLTNAILQVMPVTRIEKHRIGDGKPGPVTRDLRERFRACVERECGGDG